MHTDLHIELPGPVIRIAPVNDTHKRVTCRLIGVPVQDDGSHEVNVLVPHEQQVAIAGTTL